MFFRFREEDSGLSAERNRKKETEKGLKRDLTKLLKCKIKTGSYNISHELRKAARG